MVSNSFPSSFKSYRPQSQKVYGVILVSKDNRVLVVQGTRTGKYSFPKGHINPFETVRACAFREFEEETGLNANYYSEIGYQHLSAGGYFICESPNEDVPPINANQEISCASWKSLEELRALDVNIDINVFLKRAAAA
jgi:8-oxo-dGTP pyrophosphatase MutT (NUDIX family)